MSELALLYMKRNNVTDRERLKVGYIYKNCEQVCNSQLPMNADRSVASRYSSSRPLTEEEIQSFFAVREGMIEKAVEQCRPVLLQNIDGEMKGVWLLAQIDHWDSEKERLIFLTEHSIISLKYDFISLRLLDYCRISLKQLDGVITGKIEYPENSFMPKIHKAVHYLRDRFSYHFRSSPQAESQADTDMFSKRNQNGVCCFWNSREQLPFLKKWNPWSRDIPWITLTSHPLVQQDGHRKTNYDIDNFSKTLVELLESKKMCEIKYQPVIIENYLGLVSAFHNANHFGYFKSHGKVSF
ncbi:tumor protein p63-regulated gene 1-like protein isoform X2 [Tachypleus tridentatus]|uniref:tumor protein p63-regulated gene 1-like protein isoform X2 n=1 Tax=Tachypleus tridentatus TaxID=6853 RepID=UPI003FD2D8E7